LNTSCSVFTSEIKAMFSSLQSIALFVYKKWVIYTDSSSSPARSANIMVDNSVPFDEIQNAISECLKTHWQRTWNLETLNKLHSIQPSAKGFKSLQLSRREQVLLIRLRIGHTRFTHKYLLCREPAPTCIKCNVNQTVLHILCNCPNFNHIRFKYFNNFNPSLKELLGEPPHRNLYLIPREIGFSFLI
ncbi:uncharacterized protein LOC129230144, partial [Uloborus diversus]|uniref:uncharacterized protein LOC129230144 n=1 Tax=Uloborus diversus TaxID=327109 RepID=UPI00240A2FFC